MVATVNQGFYTLKSNLEISNLQQEAVSARQKNVRAAVEKELSVLDSFLTGSYSRNTMIAPLSEADIDIFVVLDPSNYEQDGQINLLEKVKRVLKATYPTTPELSRNGQAVTIKFTDFHVDVVPSFYRKGGGYLIPSTYAGGKWISTNPKDHIGISSKHNVSHNGDLVPLVKMIKGWNRTINRYFRSFHLEVLAWSIFDGIKISDYPSGMKYFFAEGLKKISKKLPDPAGYSDNVGFYIDTYEKITYAENLFQTAYSRALKAEEYVSNNRVIEAINEWRKIFDNCFPAYG